MIRQLLVCVAGIHAVAAAALAHFPFILVDRGGATGRLVMSEVLAPDPDVKIDLVSGAALWVRNVEGKETPLTLEAAGEFMRLGIPGEGTRVIGGKADLGVMKRDKPHLLVYYPKAIIGDAFDRATELGSLAPIELIPVRTEGGVKLRLMIDGTAAGNREVRVLTPDGDQADHKTDADGLTPVFSEGGRYGAWARHWVEEAGERGGEKYEQVRRYATLVFDCAAPTKAPSTEVKARVLGTPMPEAVASFGAVESDGWLYVYGGHTARRHNYSKESVSGRFYRLNLRGEGAWEELPGSVPVQGMNLAAWGGKIYRAGGMEPRNAAGEDADNYSVSGAAVFDPRANAWSGLPSLPQARSSHDLVAVDGKLMAIGGWLMTGKGTEPTWHETIDVLDLGAANPVWERIPQPFSRRALNSAAAGGRLYVIGGFNADEEPQLDVDVYDLATKTWTKGPPIPGEDQNGFGPATCVHDGRVYLSVATGDMYRLSANGEVWEPIAKTTPRIVHRMVAFGDEVLVVGGASDAKMVSLIEAVRVSAAER
jgi:hypothetical protein